MGLFSLQAFLYLSVFLPHKLSLLLYRYIKTSGNATVDHLSKYLAVRLALEELRSKGESNQMNLETASEKQYTIYIATANGQFTVSKCLSKNVVGKRHCFKINLNSIQNVIMPRAKHTEAEQIGHAVRRCDVDNVSKRYDLYTQASPSLENF